MKTLTLLALLLSTLAHADPAPAPNYAALLAEPTLGPVPHTPVRDQGGVGFCWAYSLSGYMEGEALKKGKKVILSPEYLALNHMPSLLYQILPVFELIDSQKSFLVQFVLDMIVVPMISTEGSLSFSQGLYDVGQIGMMPEAAFNLKFPLGKDANGNPVELHPTLKEKVQAFVTSKLLRLDWVKYYEANPEALRKDYLAALGVNPPKPTDTFVYAGRTWTPVTFMRDYLEFDPSDYQEVVVSKTPAQNIFDRLAAAGLDMSHIAKANYPKPLEGLNESQALGLIRGSIANQTAVPVAFMIYEDQKSAQSSGVFSNGNCANNACQQTVGGHAVLITGMKEVAGIDNAIIIKNSWGGNVGVDDRGLSNAGANRGFFLITNDYLKNAENQQGGNGWSFLMQKRFLPSAR